nr:uncharacterized protein LOC105337229 isoform X4 [Crassostrea gigas]
MDYSIILDFGDEPVRTVDEKLDILRFDYSWAEAVQAAEEEEERKNEVESMDQKLILEDGTRKFMIHEKRQKEIMEKVHKELMASLATRDQNLYKEAVAKIERHNEMKMMVFIEKQKMARKGTLLHNIFVQLVKNTMRRRNPVVAKMMMNNLRRHNTILAAVHEELVTRVEEKDKMKKIRALILTEMMTRVEKKEKMKKIRANILTEVMLRFTRMAEAKKKRAFIWMEIMREIRNRHQLPRIQSGTLGYEKVLDHILEKPDEDEEFVPRKLFLFDVDYFNISPEHASEPDTNRDQNPIAVNKDDESLHCFAGDPAISSMDKDTANDQEKPRRRTLRDRVKKFFGIK